MCFLLLHHRTRDDAPIVLLANRDERFDRAFEPPRWTEAKGPQAGSLKGNLRGAVLAPRDVRAGGTWLGVTRGGLLAAITNRRETADPQGTRSRGLLVDDALAQPDAGAAVAWVRAHLAREAYAGFNLLLADARVAFVVRHPGAPRPRAPEERDVVPLVPGAHALTNLHDLGEVPIPPAGRPLPDEPLAATLRRLEALAADDETPLPRDHRIFRHRTPVPGEPAPTAAARSPVGHPSSSPSWGRGTVCSAVVAVQRDGTPVFRFAAGPPDGAPFVPVA